MPFFVFGYGSLVWKPPPHTVRRVEGYVKPFIRRFAQSSDDHRGTPARPGRVVTLVRAADWEDLTGERYDAPDELRVWGVAWEIDPAFEEEVNRDLDHREKNGYTVETVDLYNLVDGNEQVSISDVTVYIGQRDNEAFIGSEPLDVLARRIHECRGPSGENKEYLYNLGQAVRDLPGSHDTYLADLEAAVKELDAQDARDRGLAANGDAQGLGEVGADRLP